MNMDVIDEDVFKESFLTEKHLTKIAIDFITIASHTNSTEAEIPSEIAMQEYTNIEEMEPCLLKRHNRLFRIYVFFFFCSFILSL